MQRYEKKELKKWYGWLEVIVDRLIPWAVLALVALIVTEFFFPTIVERYHIHFLILDYSILSIFILDLVFKYLRIRNIPNFLRTCWLDIIAVFPFILIFRVFESFLIFTELPAEIRKFQLVVHATQGVSEESAQIIKTAEESGKISRVKTIIRMFRGLERSPRVIKALAFYEQPTGKHHLHPVKGRKTFKTIETALEKKIKQVEAGSRRFGKIKRK